MENEQTLSKIQSYCTNVIGIMTTILFSLILFSTIILNRKIENPFSNTLKLPNFLYYISSAILLFCIFLTLKKQKNVKDKTFYILCILGVIFISIWDIFVAKWFPSTGNNDFGTIRNAAIGFTNGMTFEDFSYFNLSPNNANIAIFLSFLYRIIPSWTAITFLGAMATNTSALFISLAVKKKTNNNLAIFIFIISAFILGITYRAYLVYTDNYGMFFISLAIFILSLNINNKIKIPLTILSLSIAVFIKITCFIFIIALGVYFIISYKKDKKRLKTYIYTFLCFILIMTGVLFFQNYEREHYNLIVNKRTKTWHYMFMVGQNTDYIGAFNYKDSYRRKKYVYKFETKEEIEKKCLSVALTRIKERGITGNIRFYLAKLDAAYGDGNFNVIQDMLEDIKPGFFANFYLLDGKYNWFLLNIEQIIWNMILLCIFLGSMKKHKHSEINIYYIIIMGVTCYLMLFEGRSKYIFMFLPVYIYTFGLSLDTIVKYPFQINKKDIS